MHFIEAKQTYESAHCWSKEIRSLIRRLLVKKLMRKAKYFLPLLMKEGNEVISLKKLII